MFLSVFRFWTAEERSATVSSGVGPVTDGVVFSKLSKLLNQEDALSAPCLHGDFDSPQPPHGAQEDCGRLNQSLLMSHYRRRSPSHPFDKR